MARRENSALTRYLFGIFVLTPQLQVEILWRHLTADFALHPRQVDAAQHLRDVAGDRLVVVDAKAQSFNCTPKPTAHK